MNWCFSAEVLLLPLALKAGSISLFGDPNLVFKAGVKNDTDIDPPFAESPLMYSLHVLWASEMPNAV